MINKIGKIRVWLIISVLIAVVYFTVASINEKISRTELCVNNCEQDRSLKINVTVLDKFLEGNNYRGTETIKILQESGDTLDYYGNWHLSLNFLQIGVIIRKESGEFSFNIIRNGKTIDSVIGECKDCKKGCKDGFRYCNE